MSEQYAQPVFKALDDRSYDTEEEAREKSKEYLILNKLRKIFYPKGSHGYLGEYGLTWFLFQREKVITAYLKASAEAESELGGTP